MAFLLSVDKIAMWVYCSLAGSETRFILVKDQKQKELVNGFLGVLCDPL